MRTYNASDISAATDMEGVRQNPGMYVGDTDKSGTLQCAAEIIQNATDEMGEVGGGRVYVRVRGRTVTVADMGRGIPIDLHAKTKVSGLETVLTHLHAGAKSTKKSAYGGNTIGVHGVGLSAVCALSSKLSAWSFRKGSWWQLDTECGKITGKLRKADPPMRWSQGTIIQYTLDETVLPDPLDLGSLRHYCNIARCFNPVTIDYDDGERKARLEKKSPPALLDSMLAREPDVGILVGPTYFNLAGVRVVLAWTSAPDANIQAHVSGAPVPSGTHVRGLEEAIKTAFTGARGEKLSSLVGLRAVLDVSVDRPAFSGQAKTNLRTAAVHRRVVEALVAPLKRYLKEHKPQVEKALEHMRLIGKLDDRHKEQRELAKKAAMPRGRLLFPKGFLAALSTPADKRELYICEGDSAAGTIEDAKLSWQELLPLRGKMLNVISKTDKVVKNEIIGGIMRCIGYESTKFRVSRVILLADADDDGEHITVLLMALFQEKLPRLISEGRLFIVDAPLFEAMAGTVMVAGNDLNAMKRQYGKLTHVNRMKGWGGCEPALMRRVAFEPSTRKILRLAAPNEKEVGVFRELMGKASAGRKSLLGDVA